MITKRLANTLSLPIFGFIVFFTSIETASADDFCQAQCQKYYHRCQKVCAYEPDCLSDCQKAHHQCLKRCGGGGSEGSYSGGGSCSSGSSCGGE